MKLSTIAFLTSALLSMPTWAIQDIGHINSVFIFKTSYGINMTEGFHNAAEAFECSTAGGFARIPVEDNANTKEMYAALLAAHAAGRTVRINTDGCMGGHFKIGGIYINKD